MKLGYITNRLLIWVFICLIFPLLLVVGKLHAQILFPESFSIIVDSTKKFKGSISPEFNIQTQKELLIEINNTADMAIRIKERNRLVVANKLEFKRFGKTVILSGGFLYARYKSEVKRTVIPEIYSQVQWADARGLSFKYAGGINARFKFFKEKDLVMFAGVGLFYEYERWNWSAVPDDLVIPGAPEEIRNKVKLNVYYSFHKLFAERIVFDMGLYYQAAFNEMGTPRLAASGELAYKLTEHIAIGLNYQTIYDFAPIVPIDEFYYKLFNQLIVNF